MKIKDASHYVIDNLHPQAARLTFIKYFGAKTSLKRAKTSLKSLKREFLPRTMSERLEASLILFISKRTSNRGILKLYFIFIRDAQ